MKESVALAKETKKDISSTRSDNSIHRVRNEPEKQLGSLRSVIGNIRHDGGTPSLDSIATELSSMHTAQRASVLLALQRTHGNRYVQRVVTGIQAKLKVGQPGDVYEQEADRVAEQVMRMPEPGVQRQTGEEEELIQTKPLAEQITRLVQRQVEEEEEEILQTKESPGQTPKVTPAIESQIQLLKGGGQPLPKSARNFFEPRFGYDFSKVRIHSNSMAAEMAKVLSARAFTTGRDVVFGAGQYAPETDAGKNLLAHELTHVAQQRGSSIRRKLTIDQPSEQCQQESPRVARVLVKNRHHTIMKAGKQTEETLRVKFDECPVHSGIGGLHVKDQSTSLVAKEVTMDTFATLQTKEAIESVAETVTRPKLEFEIPLKTTPYGDITIKFEGEPVTAPPRGVPGATRLEMVLGEKLKLKVKTDLLNISIAEWQTKLGEIGFEGKVFIEPFEIVKAGKKLEVILLKVGLKARNTNIEEWSGIMFTFQLQFKVTAEKVLTKANRLLFNKIVAQGKQFEWGAKNSAKHLGRIADELEDTWKAAQKHREMVHYVEKSKSAKLPIFGKWAKLPIFGKILQKEGEALAARLEALQRRLQGIKAHVTGPLRRMKNFVDRATSPYFKRIAQAYMNSIQKRGILAKVIRGLGKIAGITKRIAKKLISPLFHPVVQALLLLYDFAGLVYNLIKGHLTWFWEAQGDPTSMEWEKGKVEGEEKGEEEKGEEEKGEEEKGVVELGKLLRTVKFSEMPPDEIEALNNAGCTFDLTDRIARCEHEMIMIKKNKIMIITDIYIGNIKFLPREESTKEDTIRVLVELNFPKTDIELVKKGLARVKKGTAAIIYQISGDPRRMESYLTPIDVFETIPVKKS